jgi:hypothetical protein
MINLILLQILNYLDKEWVGRRLLEANPEEMAVWSFAAKNTNGTESHMVCNTIHLLYTKMILMFNRILECTLPRQRAIKKWNSIVHIG